MHCPACRAAAPEGAKFCVECGARLATSCASCGAALPSKAKFCAECGVPAGTPPSLTVPPPAPALPASFVAGRYRVLRLLGQGAKKRVYLAHDTALDRAVAFAVIAPAGLDPAGRERMLRAARALGRLGSHPQLVSVFDIGEDGADLFIVQEFMAGGDVAKALTPSPSPIPMGEGRHGVAAPPLLPQRERGLGGEGLPLGRTLAIAKDVCRGLDAIHKAGIVHRDLKPANVFLAADGSARVGDLGLAATAGLDRITQHGTMLGTVAYMPPEQALGGEVSPKSDLYSFGALLYGPGGRPVERCRVAKSTDGGQGCLLPHDRVRSDRSAGC